MSKQDATDPPPPKDPKRGLTRLHDLEPAEISIVPSGANRRRILIMKNAEGKVEPVPEIVAKGGPGSGPQKGGGSGPHQVEDKGKGGKGKTIGITSTGKPINAKASSSAHKDFTGKEHQEAYAAHSVLGAQAQHAGDMKAAAEHGKQQSIHREKMEAHETLGEKLNSFDDAHANVQIHGYPRTHAVKSAGGDMSRELAEKGGPGSGPQKGSGGGDKAQQRRHDNQQRMRENAANRGDKKNFSAHASGRNSAFAKSDMKDMVAKTDPRMLEKADMCMKSYYQKAAVSKAAETEDTPPGEEVTLDPQVVAAGRAVVRILSPFKGRLPEALAHQLVGLSGLGDDDPEGSDDDDDGAMNIGDGEQVTKSAEDDEPKKPRSQVMGVRGEKDKGSKVTKAGKKHDDEEDDDDEDDQEDVSKLGKRDYPDAEMAMKTGGSTVKKAKGEHVSKSADVMDTPDLSGVDPKTRAAVEMVMKSQRELVTKNAELEKSNADLRGEMRKKELVQKAASWTHLGIPQEDIVAQLSDAEKVGKDAYERVEKSFTALNNQAKEGGLFKEIGSNLSSGGTSAGGADAVWGKIEAAAQGWAQKSGEKCSKAEATDKFLQTPEGQKMYGDFKAGRPEGI